MRLEFKPGTDKVVLLDDVTVHHRGESYTIRKGLVYNGANIPVFCWSLLNLHPLHHKVVYAALTHDYLYSRGLKKLADTIFRRQLKDGGCSVVQRQLMYWAVRLFGHKYVSKDKTNGK